MTPKLIVLDMFSGGGGLTEGFLRQGFEFAAHIEMSRSACQTLETRLIYHELKKSGDEQVYRDYYCGDITREIFLKMAAECGAGDHLIINEKISDENEESTIETIKSELLKKYGREYVDVVIGGPPCQAYSLVGRGKSKDSMENDPRNYLYLHYINFLDAFRPKLFVFENVPGILSAKNGSVFKDLIEKCENLQYNVEYRPLHANDFGVLQNRRRIIIIGSEKSCKYSYPDFDKEEPEGKVRDLLRDLPQLQSGEGTDDFQSYIEKKSSDYLINKKIKNNYGGVRHHMARYHNERDREIYRTAIKKWNKNGQRLNYNELPEELKSHKNRKAFLDRYKVVDGGGCSHAIVAHLSKDGHYFIHPDIKQARSLTVREAARIQSFPDDYFFEGNRGEKYTQIGNAVPPMMAEGIAKKIKSLLINPE